MNYDHIYSAVLPSRDNTCLVGVGGSDQYNRSMPGNVGASGSNLSEEDTNDHTPKEHGSLVEQLLVEHWELHVASSGKGRVAWGKIPTRSFCLTLPSKSGRLL